MSKPINVLMVEDNPANIKLTREALKDAKVQVNMEAVENGNDAMAFLRREGPYKKAPHPDIVLLDLNLPGKDGREVLAEMKKDHKLKHIPVVVLTTSGRGRHLQSVQSSGKLLHYQTCGFQRILKDHKDHRGFLVHSCKAPARGLRVLKWK